MVVARIRCWLRGYHRWQDCYEDLGGSPWEGYLGVFCGDCGRGEG